MAHAGDVGFWRLMTCLEELAGARRVASRADSGFFSYFLWMIVPDKMREIDERIDVGACHGRSTVHAGRRSRVASKCFVKRERMLNRFRRALHAVFIAGRPLHLCSDDGV